MISPRIVRTVSDNVLSRGWIFESVFDASLRSKADEDWIMSFARSGGNAIISADQKMLKRLALIRAISETGLIGIYLPNTWASQRRDEQLAYFIHWWRKIEVAAASASKGTAWIAPRGMGGGNLRQHKVEKTERKRSIAT